MCMVSSMLAGVINPKYACFSLIQQSCCSRCEQPNRFLCLVHACVARALLETIAVLALGVTAYFHKQLFTWKGPGATGRRRESRYQESWCDVNHLMSAWTIYEKNHVYIRKKSCVHTEKIICKHNFFHIRKKSCVVTKKSCVYTKKIMCKHDFVHVRKKIVCRYEKNRMYIRKKSYVNIFF